MAEQVSMRKLMHWLAASDIEVAEILKCYQRDTRAKRQSKKTDTTCDGFMYTSIHLKLADGTMRLITWLEDHDLQLKEVIIKVIDEEWQHNWDLYNWQSKELELFEVQKLNEWWRARGKVA